MILHHIHNKSVNRLLYYLSHCSSDPSHSSTTMVNSALLAVLGFVFLGHCLFPCFVSLYSSYRQGNHLIFVFFYFVCVCVLNTSLFMTGTVIPRQGDTMAGDVKDLLLENISFHWKYLKKETKRKLRLEQELTGLDFMSGWIDCTSSLELWTSSSHSWKWSWFPIHCIWGPK